MSTKTKITSLIISVVLMVAFLVVGVFAVKNTDFGVGGNISFTAKGVDATIKFVSLNNGAFADDSTPVENGKLTDVSITSEMQENYDFDTLFAPWNNLSLKFADEENGTPVTLVMSITNDAPSDSTRYIDVTTSVTQGTQDNCEVSCADENGSTISTIMPGATVNYTITFTVDDISENGSLTGFLVNFNMQMGRVPDKSTYSYLTYTPISETSQVSVRATDSSQIPNELIIPSHVSIDGKVYTVTTIESYAFEFSHPTVVHIPSTITSVGDSAFIGGDGEDPTRYENYIIDSEYVSSGLVNDDGAMGFICYYGKHLYIKKGLTVGSYVTSNYAEFESDKSGYDLYVKAQDSTTYSLLKFTPTSDNTVSVTKADSVTSSTTGTLEIPSYISIDGKVYTVTNIGANAFDGCKGFTSLILPDLIESIGSYAFQDCSGITRISIGDNLNSTIGYCAFLNVNTNAFTIVDNAYYLQTRSGKNAYLMKATSTSIDSCQIDDNCKIISYSAFANCSSLSSIYIPDSVKIISMMAFRSCSELASVSIGDNVERIEYNTFDGVKNDIFTTKDNAYYLQTRSGKNAYLMKATSSGISSCSIDNECKIISYYAFNGCSNLSNISIPSSVVTLESYAFGSCISLSSVNIPNSVKNIAGSVFSGCSNLQSVSIGKNVKSIGNYVFNGCSLLTDVYYSGTEEEWETVKIGTNNDPLLNATMHFTSTVA